MWGLAIVSLINRVSVLEDFRSDPLGSGALGRIEDADSLAQFATGLAVIIGVATIVLQMIWLFRTTRMLRARGFTTRYSQGWAIGGFFIPIAQFFIIFRMYADCRSALATQGIDSARYSLMSKWWILEIVGIVVTRVASSSTHDDVDQFITHDYTLAGGSLALLVAAILGAIVFGHLRDDFKSMV